jgi:putative tricarboxylic transport membrane protein
MCQKGEADRALTASLYCSAIGGIIGTIFLLFLSAPLARFAVRFGGPETFWICLFGLSTIAIMSKGNMVKGLISGALGMLVATVGLDPHSAAPRFTFGHHPLISGVEIIPAMIGLFSFSQVLYLVGSHKPFIAKYAPEPGRWWRVLKELISTCKTVLLRSSLIGTLVGMLPGAGGSIASIIAYNETKRWDKNPDRFGKGALEGVVASETANSALIGGAMIPTLTLGIPGCAVAAVMLGALTAKGIQPGFKIFTETGDLAYTFIMSQFAANLIMIPIGLLLLRFTVRLLTVRVTFVAIGIVMLSVIGAYAIRNSMLDVWIVLIFGVIGYFGTRVGLDNGALALGIILGPMIEEGFSRSVSLSRAYDGSVLRVFWESNIVLVLIALTIFSLLTPLFLEWKQKRMARESESPQPAKEAPHA